MRWRTPSHTTLLLALALVATFIVMCMLLTSCDADAVSGPHRTIAPPMRCRDCVIARPVVVHRARL
jgi:hypothetical protein